MIRDTRTISEQIRSGFKIAGILVVVSAASFVLVSFLPTHRIEAWWWHWKHGNSVQVGEFRVPISNEWDVWSFDTGMTREVQLVNTEGGRPLWATITITEERGRRQDIPLADLISLRRRSTENLGIHVTDTRQLAITGVMGFCLDGETMAGTPVRNISCRLGTKFSLEYIGSSLKAPSFYSILAGISKG